MGIRKSSGDGRAQSLPLWFTRERAMHWLRTVRGVMMPSGFIGASWAGMLYAEPHRHLMTYFAESPEPGNTPTPPSGPVLVMPPAKKSGKPHIWLQRLWLVVFVLFCLEVGIILTVLPWTRLWSDNSLLAGFPAIRQFLDYGFVRGLVSGLGLIDIWMGVAEAVTYREIPRS